MLIPAPGSLAPPALIVLGLDDPYGSPRLPDQSAELCAAASIRRVPGAGRWIHHDVPDLVLDELKHFPDGSELMRAFVTGATGLLGANLVRALSAGGHEVRALARSARKASTVLDGSDAQIVIGDMTDVAQFEDALGGVDVVFHAAAYFREYYAPGDHARVIDRINVEGTMALARAAHAKGVARFVNVSSAGVIGLKQDGSAGDESTPPWKGAARNLYLRSKLKAELALGEFARSHGFFAASALPAWMWGPHDAAPTASGQLVLDALGGRLPPVILPGGSSVADARDVAAGLIRIAEAGRPGERYILSGPYVEVGEMVSLLAAATGGERRRSRIPYWLAFLLAMSAETASRFNGRPSPLSADAVRLMNARLRVTSAKAARELGVSFRPFGQTVGDAVAWMRSNRKPQH